MDSTTPNVFLGFSSNELARLLESLALVQPGGSAVIVENIAPRDEHPFLPRLDLRVRRVPLEGWNFRRGHDRLMLSTLGVRGKTGAFRAFSKAKGIEEKDFATLLSLGVVVASTVRMAPGCYLEPGVVIAPFTELEFSVSLNRGVTIGHHTKLGAYTSVNPGSHVAGHCRIRERVTIGMGVVVFDGLTVGEGSVIGGGSVVTKDVPPGVLAFGNPCKVVKEIVAA